MTDAEKLQCFCSKWDDADELMAEISCNTAIVELFMEWGPVHDRGLRKLVNNTSITSITLQCVALTTETPRILFSNTNLAELHLINPLFEDQFSVWDDPLQFPNQPAKSLEVLATNTTITALSLAGWDLTDNDLTPLATNTTIRMLDLMSNNELTIAGIAALALHTAITSLVLSYCNVTTEGALVLATNTTITHLDLSNNSQIQLEGIKALALNTAITSLHLRGCCVSTRGAQALATNTTITRLDLSENWLQYEANTTPAPEDSTILSLYSSHCNQLVLEAFAYNSTITSLDLSTTYPWQASAPLAKAVQALVVNTTLTELKLPGTKEPFCVLNSEGGAKKTIPLTCRNLELRKQKQDLLATFMHLILQIRVQRAKNHW